MNEIEQYREIVNNAPEGATHHAQGMHYLALNKSDNWMRYDPNGLGNFKWFEANEFKFRYVKSFQSLDNLRTIIAQHERIAELERERDKRDIEQQIKGIMRVMACRELNLSEGDIDTLILMKEQLRKGGEQLL